MVRLGIRALIGRISRRLGSASTTLPSPTMVYSYSLPFESAKLNVSDVHSLQSVLSPPRPFFWSVLDLGGQVRSIRKQRRCPRCVSWQSRLDYPVLSLIVLNERRTVIFLHGEVVSCNRSFRIMPALLLDLYMEVVPAADAMRRIAVSLIPTSTRYDDSSFPAQSNNYLIMSSFVGHLLGSERSWKVYSVRGQMLLF